MNSMSEQKLVTSLLQETIGFPWRSEHKIRHTTELRITRNRADIVFFEETPDGDVGTIIAVEAKLKNWRQAIQQAYRDRLFADRVYVALPSEHASSAIENISQFRQTSVGLIIWEDDRAKVYYHPPRNRSVSRWHVTAARSNLSALVPSK
jgi:hypothetical protein